MALTLGTSCRYSVSCQPASHPPSPPSTRAGHRPGHAVTGVDPSRGRQAAGQPLGSAQDDEHRDHHRGNRPGRCAAAPAHPGGRRRQRHPRSSSQPPRQPPPPDEQCAHPTASTSALRPRTASDSSRARLRLALIIAIALPPSSRELRVHVISVCTSPPARSHTLVDGVQIRISAATSSRVAAPATVRAHQPTTASVPAASQPAPQQLVASSSSSSCASIRGSGRYHRRSSSAFLVS